MSTTVVESINELSNLAKKLNQKSDELTATIETLNRKLNTLSLGVEVWCDRYLVEVDDFQSTDDAGNPCEPWANATLLGFAKVDDKWQLAVKFAEVTDNGNQHEPYGIRNSYGPQALIGSSREIRIAAMEAVPSLLDALEAKAKNMLKAIDEAKQRAEKL